MKLILVAFLLFPRAAIADEAQARAHFETGRKLSAAGSFRAALAEFSAGWELSHRPLFLFNMAECARESGDIETARVNYRRYLEADPGGKLADKARERILALPPEPAPPPQPPPAPPAPPPAIQVAAPAPLPSLSAVSPPPPRSRKGLWIGLGVAGGLVVSAIVIGVSVAATGGPCSGTCLDLR